MLLLYWMVGLTIKQGLMIITYHIDGMTCNGCRNHVKESLSVVEGVMKASVDLEKGEAIIESNEGIPLDTFKAALAKHGGRYQIQLGGEQMVTIEKEKPAGKGTGVFYCPMHCEGEKTYDENLGCPVCGMDLVEELSLTTTTQFSCPMHPEIISDKSGACPICGMDLVVIESDISGEDKTYNQLLNKFWIALAFTIPIFVIAMSDMVDGNPLYSLTHQKNWNWIQFILSIPVVFYVTRMFFERAWNSIRTANLNMFTLIGIGSGIAWLFSVFALLFPEVFPADFKTQEGNVFVYFEAATVILTLVLMGQVLEARAHRQTSGAIKALLNLVPAVATLVEKGIEKTISINAIQRGNLLRVKPGEKIPVDGIIVTGHGTVDESMITGEPIPVDKMNNDTVHAGTINSTTSFVMQAEKVGAETLLSQIVQMVNTASRSKAPIQKLADKISKYFVPIVLTVSVLTFIIWAIFGPEPAYVYAFVNAIAVLIIACPCALGLATPVSVMVGVGRGAQAGILIKNAEALERMNEINTLIIDKTGTITEGKPSVEKIIACEKDRAADVTTFISSLSQYSEHPLSQAIINYGKTKNIPLEEVDNFETITGKGVQGLFHSKKIALGNNKLMQHNSIIIPESLAAEVLKEQNNGKTVSYISEGNQAVGYVTIIDAIKPTSVAAVKALQQNGVEVIMLTGDNKNTARSVAEKLDLKYYKAECLPQDKLNEIKVLQSKGKVVAMAGDGINDAPALAQADVGIAMGTGTDVAIESAAITLVKGDLQGIRKARHLSHSVVKNIRQNLFFAFVYNILGVPIAAGILFPIMGLLLSPMIAAVAMSFSSVSVITNALRLRNLRL